MDEKSGRIPLSYLSQYGYCPRRAALLMLEQVWEENEYTASGRAQHERAHAENPIEKRGSLVKLFGHTVYSEKFGLSGKCDCIEAEESPQGCFLPFLTRRYRLFPVEYKHGVVRNERVYRIQLCAQAMCLEEMYGAFIPNGALFFINAHRRDVVEFDADLREKVTHTATMLRRMAEEGHVPAAEYGPRCKKCSLADYCGPKIRRTAKSYCDALLLEVASKEGEECQSS
jgi:CRISPR-associated exonuclease Cas4